MSSDFLMTLSGQVGADVRDTAKKVLAVLLAMKFEHVTYVDEIRLDPSDRTFEPTDRFASDDMSPPERLTWMLHQEFGQGLMVNLASPWAQVDLMLGAAEGAFNCHVGITKTALNAFFRDQALGNLHGLYGRIAEASEAVGGFGGMDRDPVLLAPKDVLAAVMDDPGNPGFPASLGILSSKLIERDRLEKAAAGRFVIHAWGPYWVLEERDFLDVYTSLNAG